MLKLSSAIGGVDSIRRIRLIFFLHALAIGGFYARIPDIQARLHIDDATLGLAFLSLTLGAIATFLFASRAIERLGTRTILIAGLPGMGAGAILIGLAPNASALFAVLLIYAVGYSLTNIAMNVEADRIEAVTSLRVLNSCHGLWSLGYLCAALLGTLATSLGLSPAQHFSLVSPVVIAASLFAMLHLQPAPPRPHSGQMGGTFSLPTPKILLLVGFVFGPSLLEGSLRNWSVIYMRDSFSAPAWVDTLTLPAFLIAQSSGRLMTDGLVTRFGVVWVARVLTIVAAFGLMTVVAARDLNFALFGFLLIGFGVCASYPLTASAAARLADRPSSQNVTSLSLVTQSLLLGAPAVLGFIAQRCGMRLAFAALFPSMLLAIWLARCLASDSENKSCFRR